ncbi:MAG: hypothetical protein IKK70_05535 [Clostridia bacterium]|nr:hypothetical protein [Clostridia bacterium]
MKKQIIVIVSVALAAVLLFTAYAVFFKDDGIEEVGDPFYTLSDDTVSRLGETDHKVEILLSGYDGDDEYWEMIYRFSEAIADTNRKFSVKTDDGSASVKVSANGGSREIAFDDFFKKLYDGTVYAFDGESLILNAIYSLCGMEEQEIELRALSGYDTDGDSVTATGAPFIFPSLSRSQIAFLTITNSHGSYSIYKDEGDFYFGDSRAVGYDDEKFSLLTTNCRYAVAYGKMDIPEGQSWDSYGLNSEKPATATYSLMTDSDSEGNYFLHTVHIGNLSSTGNYYFARYIGGKFAPSGSDSEGDKLLHNLSKDFIYFIPVDSVDGSIALPQTDIMQPTLVNAISNNEQLITIDNIRVDLFGDGVSAVAKRMSDFNAASNLAAVDTSSLTKVISDKKSASDYSAYSGGWMKHIDVFGAFTSSDGKDTYIEAALARASKSGEYTVSFGLLRDEANGAYLPAKMTLTKSYDGVNWHPIEGGEISLSHSDGRVQKYELTFSDESVVKYVRFGFDVPQKAKTYVVFDEIRIFTDGEDAQPASAIGGTWKLTAPNEYIASGMNYNFLDMVNFNNFVQIMASLEGERVVACGFTNHGDASSIDKEILAKYGLDNPDKHFSFTYSGVVTDIYASKKNENGKYYLYSTFSGQLNGKDINASTDVIVEVSAETAPFLDWGMVDYLDHSLFSIYIVDIEQMDITVDGKDKYEFKLTLNSEGDVGDVQYNGKSYDVTSFKYFYQSILSISMKDEYVPEDGETAEEYFRIKIHTETNSPEIVFYRVSASRCYFTVDGQGSYFALFTDVDTARDKLFAYLNGETITR